MTAAANALPLPSTPPRAMGWATPLTLTCPRGHHLKHDSVVLDHGALRCKHRDPLRGAPGRPAGGGPECGAWLYVVMCYYADPGMVRYPGDATRLEELGEALYVAEVSWPELLEIRRLRLTPPQVFERLGATFPFPRR